MAGARDRHDIRRAGQNPGERKLRRGAVLGRGMRLQFFDQRKVAAQIVALKPRQVAPCVARPKGRDRDLAGQETAAKWAVGDKADAELLASGRISASTSRVLSEYS